MDCTLAISIATYERPKLIDDFLKNCAQFYTEAGIDIYFYDSSKSDETEKLVRAWADNGHVFHIKISPDVRLSEKMLMILQGYGLKKGYDFISLSNDATQYSKAAMDYLMVRLDTRYDFVIYQYGDYGTFTDPNKFFEACGVDSQHLGNTFINTHTVLKNVDWSSYESLFLPTEENAQWAQMGAYYVFYYRRFLELKRFRALALRFTKLRTMRWTSGLKKTAIYDEDLLRCVCEGWTWTYERLPAYYRKKWKVCQRAASVYITGTLSDFLMFRRQGLFNTSVLKQYWDVWKKVSSVPRPLLAAVSVLPPEMLEKHFENKKKVNLGKLEIFCHSYSRIILYGAGTTGYIISNYLTEHDLEFDGFCVSIRKPGKYEFNGKKVYLAKELLKEDLTDTGFIMAMRQGNTKTVLHEFKDRIDSDQIFYYDTFLADIRSEMEYAYYSGYIK